MELEDANEACISVHLQAAADALGELEEIKERLLAAEDSLTSQQEEVIYNHHSALHRKRASRCLSDGEAYTSHMSCQT